MNGGNKVDLVQVEMGYQKGGCGMTRWDSESNKNAHEKCVLGVKSHIWRNITKYEVTD